VRLPSIDLSVRELEDMIAQRRYESAGYDSAPSRVPRAEKAAKVPFHPDSSAPGPLRPTARFSLYGGAKRIKLNDFIDGTGRNETQPRLTTQRLSNGGIKLQARDLPFKSSTLSMLFVESLSGSANTMWCLYRSDEEKCYAGNYAGTWGRCSANWRNKKKVGLKKDI
jgi:hypothetical protein